LSTKYGQWVAHIVQTTYIETDK